MPGATDSSPSVSMYLCFSTTSTSTSLDTGCSPVGLPETLTCITLSTITLATSKDSPVNCTVCPRRTSPNGVSKVVA